MAQELSEWACIYIKYLQIFRTLEMAYDQMLQPQKRQDMKKALEACMGRMVEIRHWLVRDGSSSHTGSLLWRLAAGLCTSLWQCSRPPSGWCRQDMGSNSAGLRIDRTQYTAHVLGACVRVACVGRRATQQQQEQQQQQQLQSAAQLMCCLLQLRTQQRAATQHAVLCAVLQVKLNRGLDFVQLDDLLVDLKLTPDVLEVPVPRYFIEDRAKVGAQHGMQLPLGAHEQQQRGSSSSSSTGREQS